MVASTVGLMAEQVDAVIVMDHGSTDGTRDVLSGLSGRYPLLVLDDADPLFRQSEAMNQLVTIATENLGADWIVPFDADEVWDLPEDPPSDADTVRFRAFDHVIVNGVDGMPYRRSLSSSTKVMFRPGTGRRLVMGNHSVSQPGQTVEADGIVHHFPNRSVAQFERKVRRGVATYREGDYGGHWHRMAAQIDEEGAESLFRHFHADSPDGLVYDPVQPKSSV